MAVSVFVVVSTNIEAHVHRAEFSFRVWFVFDYAVSLSDNISS